MGLSWFAPSLLPTIYSLFLPVTVPSPTSFIWSYSFVHPPSPHGLHCHRHHSPWSTCILSTAVYSLECTWVFSFEFLYNPATTNGSFPKICTLTILVTSNCPDLVIFFVGEYFISLLIKVLWWFGSHFPANVP